MLSSFPLFLQIKFFSWIWTSVLSLLLNFKTSPYLIDECACKQNIHNHHLQVLLESSLATTFSNTPLQVEKLQSFIYFIIEDAVKTLWNLFSTCAMKCRVGPSWILQWGCFEIVPTLAQESLHMPCSNQFAVPDARAALQMLLEIQILLTPS